MQLPEYVRQNREGESSMKCNFRLLLMAVLALTVVFFINGATSLAHTELQEKTAAAAQEEEQDPGYEEEYNAWDSASKEPDFQKRGSLLLELLKKNPKSKMIPYVDSSYINLLIECTNSEKYQDLEILGEKWLALHPNDLNTIAHLANAAQKLGHDDKFVQYQIAIYKLRPTGSLAREIATTFKKMKNKAKYLEWIDIVLKDPAFQTDFMLRLDLVQFFVDEKDLAKTIETANSAIKAADLVQDPSAETKTAITKVRRTCHDIIGRSLIEQDKYADAIKAFAQALKTEKYCDAYYWIAHCQRKLDKVDDAVVTYAKAELQGGECAPKSKAELEKIYKILHNNTTFAIEKVYKKAKEQPDNF
jgi:tetratricopeptide (TPR) repeat protein